MAAVGLLLFFWVICGAINIVEPATDSNDYATLQSLMQEWQNLPPSWTTSTDPCEAWEGVTCKDSRVTALGLSTMSLKGAVNGNIGGLTELILLDLSYNPDLTGPLSSALGRLVNLNSLTLIGCSFTGNIPDEIGNLASLTFLALNNNNFTGSIPSSLGKLSNLQWLDLADNQLTGSIPVSSSTTSGLDLLFRALHFHLNNNQLSGTIPETLFSSQMQLIHVLFDGNKLTGSIPTSLGTVQSLEVVRLDRNLLSGKVPTNINNLTNVNELHLAGNKLTGPLPNLNGMSSLNYVDLSSNSFDASEAPDWFSTLSSLTTLFIEYGSLQGPVPSTLFSFPQLQQVKLRNNSFNGTLNMSNIGSQLTSVDIQYNQISSVTIGGYANSLTLIGNPVCESGVLSNSAFCKTQSNSGDSYSTSLAKCGTKECPADQGLNPQSCECAYPYQGVLTFRAPPFRDLSNSTRFHSLELSLWTNLGLTPGYVFLDNLKFNAIEYLDVDVALFPPTGMYFNRSEVQALGRALSLQTYKPPDGFGPFVFIATPYTFQATNGGKTISTGVIVGIAVGCAVLLLVLVGVGIYALWQRKRVERAKHLSQPFASWAPTGDDADAGSAPQLKGTRCFSFNDIKKATNSFSSSNEIGSGGYGKVYKGILGEGQVVAIKRAQKGSMQGALEFKTEIELLSRVHHKNLVSLVGFCFEQGEQMLVYEYMANGTIRDCLSGKSGIHLDWERRLRIALGSARGLSYLHELADPPIIHRDIKSTNILLDDKMVAKVADFGLSKLVSDTDKGHVSTQVKGTLGYLDPEYYMTQQLSEKSDVYSFGVFMLELITGNLPIQNGKYIVREVKMAMNKDVNQSGMEKLIDPSIKGMLTAEGFGAFLELAMKCVEEEAVNRPTMNLIVKSIELILQDYGQNTPSTSAASSATDFVRDSGRQHTHLYDDGLPKNYTTDSEAFHYSGSYTNSAKIEPK
uniref:non-specific serine/threonine protein kinase n=1 Tax=Kalanchoe fedtschenkoi TaxID=63787 RepID=A0A7N0T398_KALFE